VCLVPASPAAAQARYRVTSDGAWFYQEAGGKRLARLARGSLLTGGAGESGWVGATLEGWIFATSVGTTTRAGFDLAVTRAPDENLRSAPAGALVAKLPQGFLLTKVTDGSTGRWIHVTRSGWLEQDAVEPLAPVASAPRAASADSDSSVARRGAGRRSAPPSGNAPDTAPPSSAPVDPSRLESARRTVLYRAPDGPLAGTLAPAAPLRVLGR
jgi:hypothetical protein